MLYQAYQVQSDLLSPMRMLAQWISSSFWLSGTGRTLPSTAADGEAPLVDSRLQSPWRTGDGAAWCEAWRALDADRLRAALARATCNA